MTRTKHEVVTKTLTADVAIGGTFTVAYPESRTPEDFSGGTDHQIITNSAMPFFAAQGHFSIAYGASEMTVTMNRGGLTDGTTVYLHLDRAEPTSFETVALPANMSTMEVVKINLGAPDASDGDGAVASQACTAAGGLATGINGALAADGVATFDVPRNVVAAWTGAAVLTVTGTDVYGNTIVESSGSGTSMTGKKAFKTVTGVSTSADITGLTVGTSKVLGLPAFLADAVDVLAEAEDGAAPTAGTIVAGDIAAATATTGDVRGTYAPNSAPNGTKVFELTVAMRAPSYTGGDQYAG